MTTSRTPKHQATQWPPRGPARVLLLLDRPTLIELVKLTLLIATINAWNRMAISFRAVPGLYQASAKA